MPNAITNVGFGSPYAAEQMDIQRRQKLAQMLQQQSMEPIQQQQGGMFTPRTGWAQMLAKGVQAYKGKQGIEEGKTQQDALAQKMQQERQQALAQALQQGQGSPQPAPEMGGGPAMPPNPMGAAQTLAGASDPALQQAGLGMMGKQFEAQMPQRPPSPQEMAFKQQENEQNRLSREAAAAMASQDRQAAATQSQNVQRELATQSQGVQRELARMRTDAQATKPPPGYRPTTEGNLQAIPGGPADLKQQGVFNQDTAALGSMQSDMDRLAAEANRLKEHPGLSKATGAMGWVPGVGGLATIPGTEAANFKAGLGTLQSQVAFGVLQNMRNNSKTGGALGQVSDKEGQLLAANLAAIDRAQSPEEFRNALDRIVKYTEGAKDRLRNAYNLKHGNAQETPQRRSTDRPAAGKLTPQEQQELDALRKRFGR